MPDLERKDWRYYRHTSAALTLLKKQPETIWLNAVSCVPTRTAASSSGSSLLSLLCGQSQVPQVEARSMGAVGRIHRLGLQVGWSASDPGQDAQPAGHSLELPVALW